MKQTLWILRVLLSHWWRHPMQLTAFIVGLMSATALWSGVQAINLHARASYDRAAAALGGSDGTMLVPAFGQDVAPSVFADLRRGGWLVSPVVDGRIRLRDRQIRLIGIEPISLPRGGGPTPSLTNTALQQFLAPDGQMLVAPETAAELGLAEGARVSTDSGLALPPIHISANTVPDVLVTDIGMAQRLLRKDGRISRFIVDTQTSGPRASLDSLTGNRLTLVQGDESRSDLQRLTDSFHLNLSAFGFLSFVVGLFIVHATIGLVCEQRLATFRTLRACGVTLRRLLAVISLELIVLSLAAGLAGLLAGYLVARMLLPDVAASLSSLYGASVSSRLLTSPQWWISGMAIAIAGTLVAAAHTFYRVYRLPLLASAQPQAWQQAQRRWRIWLALLAVGSLLTAVGSFWLGEGTIAGFVMLGSVTIAAALVLPLLLGALLRGGYLASRRPLLRWIWADSAQQLSGIAMALMALLIALAVNIGVSTMVSSFNNAFLQWLDGRLLADVYVAARDNRQATQIEDWLKDRPEVRAVLPNVRAETKLQGEVVEIAGLPDHAVFRDAWPLLAQTDDAWGDLAAGRGVLVSEQLSRRLHLESGMPMRIPLASGDWQVTVVGIYADYGNPKGQLSVNAGQLVARSPDADRSRLGLLVAPTDRAGLMAQLERQFGLAGRSLADQASVKQEARKIFDRTFAVTAVLNTFTLGVAGFALLTSLLSLAETRLPQLAPVWAMGVTGRALAALEFCKTVLLALLTAVLALPLGLFVAWCLIDVVNVKAFGWRLPFVVFPADLAVLMLVALATAGLASLVPIIRLARLQPATLLKTFANER